MGSSPRWPAVPGGLEWQDEAACVGQLPSAAFFPAAEEVTPAISALCGSCPVRQACLDLALASGASGIWAATTTDDRRRLLRLGRAG